MSATRKRRSPLRSANYGNGRKSAGNRTWKEDRPSEPENQADDFPTTRERFSAPAHNLIALLEEKAISIALRSERYHGAEDIIHRVKFTIPRYQEIAAKLHDGIIDVLIRETDWKTYLTTLHADPEIAALIFAAFPCRTFTSAESDLHRSLKNYIAQL